MENSSSCNEIEGSHLREPLEEEGYHFFLKALQQGLLPLAQASVP